MTTCVSAWGQNKYPFKTVYEGDTVVMISIDQVKKINHLFLNNDFMKEMNDTLANQNKQYVFSESLHKSLIQSYEKQISLYKGATNESTLVINNFKKIEKKLKRQKFIWRTLAISTSVFAGLEYACIKLVQR